MKHKYFSMEKTEQTATINIYGDITSWAWFDDEISAATLSKQLEALGDIGQIDVYINSYGGEVAEGLAIYNALRRHKAKIRTFCDGFACSIASVVFMAGDERIMNEASLLMIHNAWTYASGNSEELRKQADDLEKINQASIEAYKAHSSLNEEEIKTLMDAETWILPDEALSYGFATSVDKTENEKTSQNAFKQLFEIIKAHQEQKSADDEKGTGEPEDKDPKEDLDKTGKTDDNKPDSGDKTEDEENKDNDDAADQKWGGFFNAIMKM